MQTSLNMVPKWGSGRLVRHKSGQEANPGPRRHRDADSWGRFGRPLGVMLGLMLGLCWHLFSWWFFDAVRTSFWTPTWSEIEAKIEPKTFPKTSKFRTWKSMPKMIENAFNFDEKISDFGCGFWWFVNALHVACLLLLAWADVKKTSKNTRFWNDFWTSSILLEHEIVFEIWSKMKLK